MLELLTEKEINETINASSKMGGLDTNKVSDGYHTFGELYDHRIENFITVCRLIDDKEFNTHGGAEYGSVWRSKNHCDGEPIFGGTWFVLGINKEPGKQITYHLPISRWDECDFARELPTAPEWDGHTSADVLERLKNL